MNSFPKLYLFLKIPRDYSTALRNFLRDSQRNAKALRELKLYSTVIVRLCVTNQKKECTFLVFRGLTILVLDKLGKDDRFNSKHSVSNAITLFE